MATTTNTATGNTLDRWFEITKRGATVAGEVRGGIVTFITMAYIVVLNPLILGYVKDSTGLYLGGGTAPNIALVAASTAIVAGVLTLIMGLYGRVPLGVAAGLGLNGFVAYGIASQTTWKAAMGLVVLEGIIIMVMVLTGFRRAVFNSVPRGLLYAIGVGIGLFITLIGFVDAGFVRAGIPLVKMGTGGTLTSWPEAVFVFGLLVTAVLVARRTKGGILIGILATTALALIVEAQLKLGPQLPGGVNPNGWSLTVPKFDANNIVSTPKFDLFGQIDLTGAFKFGAVAAVLEIFSLVLADFFDAMGTVYAVSTEAGILDENGEVPHFDQILQADAFAAALGGFGGTSSNTAYIESASGVGEGAKTGLASVVTGLLLLLSAFVAPLTNVIPHEAATPALVIVGFLMMTHVKNINFDDYEIGIPAFLTIVLMPFTYDIGVGIGAGFISYCAIKLFNGKTKEVKPLMWVVSVAFIAYFAIHPLRQVFGV